MARCLVAFPLLLLLASSGCATPHAQTLEASAASPLSDLPAPASLDLSGKVYLSDQLSFTPHTGPGYASYLVRDVNYEPVKALRLRLEAQLHQQLTNRGEAHITVISPVEYQQTLKRFITIEQIDDLAKASHLATIPFTAQCVGKGSAKLQGSPQQTYYVVVQSPGLIALRRKIQAAYIAQGGGEDDFEADDYYPHITLGFTQRDLFEQDGVTKDLASCIYQINLGL